MARLFEHPAFRLALALFFLAFHLFAIRDIGKNTFGVPFNAAPASPPAFAAANEGPILFWDRLAVSRWDSVHYLGLALRGYSTCPPGPLLGKEVGSFPNCQLSFYPGYPALGWLASFAGRWPMDYALLGVSLAAALVFLFLWTDGTLRRALGMKGCLLSLVAFNVFPTAFALATIQTEAVVLACTLGSFVAFQRRRPFLSSFLAGLASGVRVTGAAASLACSMACLVGWWKDPDRRKPSQIIGALSCMALSVWGLGAMMAYHESRFGDPLIYFHAHSQAFGHGPSVMALLWPKVEIVLRSLDHPEHEGMWVAAAFLWLALGFRQAMSGFSQQAKVFWMALTAATLGISLLGSVELAFAGMIRYLLLALPVFFSIGTLGKRFRAAYLMWLVLSGWHYLHVNLCSYVGNPGDETLRRCSDAHWVGRI